MFNAKSHHAESLTPNEITEKIEHLNLSNATYEATFQIESWYDPYQKKIL